MYYCSFHWIVENHGSTSKGRIKQNSKLSQFLEDLSLVYYPVQLSIKFFVLLALPGWNFLHKTAVKQESLFTFPAFKAYKVRFPFWPKAQHSLFAEHMWQWGDSHVQAECWARAEGTGNRVQVARGRIHSLSQSLLVSPVSSAVLNCPVSNPWHTANPCVLSKCSKCTFAALWGPKAAPSGPTTRGCPATSMSQPTHPIPFPFSHPVLPHPIPFHSADSNWSQNL